MDIHCELQTGDIRNLYDAVCDAIQYWPGSPARPPQQQEDFKQLRSFLFSLLCEASLADQ